MIIAAKKTMKKNLQINDFGMIIAVIVVKPIKTQSNG